MQNASEQISVRTFGKLGFRLIKSEIPNWPEQVVKWVYGVRNADDCLAGRQ